MATREYRIFVCDKCGKEEEREFNFYDEPPEMPHNWVKMRLSQANEKKKEANPDLERKGYRRRRIGLWKVFCSRECCFDYLKKRLRKSQ